MINQNTFMETLRSVAEIAKTSPEPLSKEEIQEYFKEMELTEEQQNLVYEYLLHAPEEEAKELERAAQAAELEETEGEGQDAAEQYDRTFSGKASDYDDVTGGQQETHSDEIEEYDEQAIIEANWEKYKPNTKEFKMYMEDLASIKPCTPEEMNALYVQLAAGDDAAIAALSNQWLSHVLEIAKQHASASIHVEDVIQEGNMGLFMGLQSLLGKKECKDPEQVLTQAVTDAMHVYISEETSGEDTEHTIVGKVALIYEARKLLKEEKGKEPSNRELAEYTKLSAEEIEDILAMAKEKK